MNPLSSRQSESRQWQPVSPLRKLLLVTDAWEPQINGVVRCYQNVFRELRLMGMEVELLEPSAFPTTHNPLYKDVRLALPRRRQVAERMRRAAPDAVHIATEGPLGLVARSLCRRWGWSFTTSFHTNWPIYMWTLARVPAPMTWGFCRWFHRPSKAVMVPTPSMQRLLAQEGLKKTALFSRGVDTGQFSPHHARRELGPRPVMGYVGRVSYEKGVQDFLACATPGTKVVVGDGPALEALKAKFPEVVWLGFREGQDLAELYSSFDVTVFPSKTDTFGQVILESLASGTPVAATPSPGPIDIITTPGTGALHTQLDLAIRDALAHADSEACVAHAQTFSWPEVARQFYSNLSQITPAQSKSRAASVPAR